MAAHRSGMRSGQGGRVSCEPCAAPVSVLSERAAIRLASSSARHCSVEQMTDNDFPVPVGDSKMPTPPSEQVSYCDGMDAHNTHTQRITQ